MSDAPGTCSHCGAPSRLVWPPSSRQPKLDVRLQRSWLKLLECPACAGHWLAVPHEPYGAFTYLSRWTSSPADWLAIYALDEGSTLARWGDWQVATAWPRMDESDRADIEHHRGRSFGRNPLDQRAEEPPPDIERLLAEVSSGEGDG